MSLSMWTIKQYEEVDASAWAHGLATLFCGFSIPLCQVWAVVSVDLNAEGTGGSFGGEKYKLWKLARLKQGMEVGNWVVKVFWRWLEVEAGQGVDRCLLRWRQVWQADRVKLGGINCTGWTEKLTKFDRIISALGPYVLFDLYYVY